MLNEPVEGTEQGLARLLGLGVAPCRAAGGLRDRLLAEHGLPRLEARHNDLLVGEGRGRDETSVHFRIREHLKGKKEGVIFLAFIVKDEGQTQVTRRGALGGKQ